MSEQTSGEVHDSPRIVVVGPDGVATESSMEETSRERPVTEMIEQPAKVMRVGNMIRQLL
ncbi:MAG TPA: proteasome activator, partial [Streptosporangiaceae bacterium]|nr:proteasome activator [Streptosporangiaceae bacterium]